MVDRQFLPNFNIWNLNIRVVKIGPAPPPPLKLYPNHDFFWPVENGVFDC